MTLLGARLGRRHWYKGASRHGFQGDPVARQFDLTDEAMGVSGDFHPPGWRARRHLHLT